MSEIINFSDFFKNKIQNTTFDKKEILENLFIEEEPIEEIESEITDSKSDIDKRIEELQRETKSTYEEKEIVLPSDSIENDSNEYEEGEEDEIEIESKNEEKKSHSEKGQYYKLFKDKSEVFSCEIELEGAKLRETEVRLILETNDWNLVFTGEIDERGKVKIPIKKLNLFDEGTVGKIKMEVIAEGTRFIPWEDKFKINLSKKVMVKFNESNEQRSDKPKVKVNFKK